MEFTFSSPGKVTFSCICTFWFFSQKNATFASPSYSYAVAGSFYIFITVCKGKWKGAESRSGTAICPQDGIDGFVL